MRRNTLTVILGAALTLTAATALAVPQSTKPSPDGAKARSKADSKAKIGEAAPDFALKDVEGKEYKLSNYKGKIVILQWINRDCPICRRVTTDGTVKTMLTELKMLDENIVHIAIDSTHYADLDAGAKYFKEHKIKSPALIDKDGTVGRLYGAKTTPHMYVIDAEGILRYNGAIDDSPRGKKDESTNYVINAVQQMKKGETVAPDEVKPYGCSVKYARGEGDKQRGNRGRGKSSGGVSRDGRR